MDRKTKAALYTVLAVIGFFLMVFLTVITHGLFALLIVCGLVVAVIYFSILDELE